MFFSPAVGVCLRVIPFSTTRWRHWITSAWRAVGWRVADVWNVRTTAVFFFFFSFNRWCTSAHLRESGSSRHCFISNKMNKVGKTIVKYRKRRLCSSSKPSFVHSFIYKPSINTSGLSQTNTQRLPEAKLAHNLPLRENECSECFLISNIPHRLLTSILTLQNYRQANTSDSNFGAGAWTMHVFCNYMEMAEVWLNTAVTVLLISADIFKIYF